MVFIHDFQTLKICVSFNHVDFQLDSTVAVIFYCLWACVLDCFYYLGQTLFREFLRTVFEFLCKFKLVVKRNVSFDVAFKVVIIVIVVIFVVVVYTVIKSLRKSLLVPFFNVLGIITVLLSLSILKGFNCQAPFAFFFPATNFTDIGIENLLICHLLHLVQLFQVFDALYFQIYLFFYYVKLIILVI